MKTTLLPPWDSTDEIECRTAARASAVRARFRLIFSRIFFFFNNSQHTQVPSVLLILYLHRWYNITLANIYTHHVIVYITNNGTRWWFVITTLCPICHCMFIIIDDGRGGCRCRTDSYDCIIGIIHGIIHIIALV